jgi:hypothetical protein
MQKDKALFDELVAADRPISLKDFNLYVFRGLRGEFKDLITSFVINVEPLSYANLHSHLLMHGFIHKSSHPSIGSAAINASLLPTPNTSSSTLFLNTILLGTLVEIGSFPWSLASQPVQ